MKKFIQAAFCFCAIVILLIGGACALEVWAEIVHYRYELRAPEGTSVLICGDSRTELGLDPEFWPSLFNFSVSGRPIDQSYLTVCDVLAANPGKFRTLLVDVSPENASIDLGLSMGEMKHGGKYILLHFLHPRIQTRAWSGAFGVFRDLLVDRRLRLLNRVIRGKRKFSSSLRSGYRKWTEQLKVTDAEKFDKSVSRQYAHTRAVMEGENSAVLYFNALQRLVAYAREKGMEPVLLTAPWHPDLIGKFGQDKVRKFTDAVAGFARKHRCRYFNMMEMKVPDQNWKDCNHLNYRGAADFTRVVRKFVEGD